MNGSPWLLWCVVFLPLAGAVAFGVLPRRLADRVAPPGGVAAGAATLAFAVAVAAGFDYGRAGVVQFSGGGSGVVPRVGVDGLSLPYLLLAALLALVCLVRTLRALPEPGRPRAFVCVVLALETGLLATFAAQNLLLFFIAFEACLGLVFFLIGIWGGPRRHSAALAFLIYTLAASVLLLVGFVVIYVQAGTFDLVVLARRHDTLSGAAGVVAFATLLTGFAVKVPAWPLHGWLAGAHTEAPTAGSVLLAGVLLKTGMYGLIRIAVPLLPDAFHRFAPWLGALGVIGILYGFAAALAQPDLKRLVAYSSVGHMGFVLLGIATLTPRGLDAAVFAGVAHGLVTGLLFLLVGGVRDRCYTSAFDAIPGVLGWAPRLGRLLVFASFAALGLPGLAGFWGEAYAIAAALSPACGLPGGLFAVYAALAAAGTLLAAAVFLRVLREACLGRPRPDVGRVRDAVPTELAAALPLAAAAVALGVWPNGLMRLIDPAVRVVLRM